MAVADGDRVKEDDLVGRLLSGLVWNCSEGSKSAAAAAAALVVSMWDCEMGSCAMWAGN